VQRVGPIVGRDDYRNAFAPDFFVCDVCHYGFGKCCDILTIIAVLLIIGEL
jgi:hypothetical protein